jgi:glycosyltransferase involved in cell wall biosynthesis
MKIHTIFVEPANYTQDLIINVHNRLNLKYSFLYSTSIASNNTDIISTAQYLFDKNGLWKNIHFLWQCSKQNDLVIVNGYNHISFIILWFFSMINECSIGIESDTPFKKDNGIKSLIKTVYLKCIFSNKKILGLPGGTGQHKDLFLKYGMSENRIFFLPMMVDNSKYYKSLNHISINHNTLVRFIFVGRLAPEKNTVLLVKSFQEILSQGLNAELIIVGDGVCRDVLETLSKDFPMIKFFGKKFGLDLLMEYQKAHVMVLPSSFEPWGLVVNESMSAGLPVLCSSVVGAAYDLVLSPNTGWVFDTENQQELTSALIKIIEHPEQITDKAIRGQNYMMNYWNYDLYIKNLTQIFDHVKYN